MTDSDNMKSIFHRRDLVELRSPSAPVRVLLSVAFLLCLVFWWTWSGLGPPSMLFLLEKALVTGWLGLGPRASG